MKPFLKWAGGKGRLTKEILDLLPAKIKTYHEPFLGGGAVFFALASETPTRRYKEARLSDTNRKLVATYQAVAEYDALKAQLEELARRYKDEDAEALYYEVRARYGLGTPAEFIFLNKTGYNGLHRVNREGEFNVSFGKRENPSILDADNLWECSKVLWRAEVVAEDFAEVYPHVRAGDAVYLDPPYLPMSPKSFTRYTSDNFGVTDHRELAAMAELLARNGVRVVVSNVDTPLAREIYAGLEEVYEVSMRRNINSKGSARGPVGELLFAAGPKGKP